MRPTNCSQLWCSRRCMFSGSALCTWCPLPPLLCHLFCCKPWGSDFPRSVILWQIHHADIFIYISYLKTNNLNRVFFYSALTIPFLWEVGSKFCQQNSSYPWPQKSYGHHLGPKNHTKRWQLWFNGKHLAHHQSYLSFLNVSFSAMVVQIQTMTTTYTHIHPQTTGSYRWAAFYTSKLSLKKWRGKRLKIRCQWRWN